MTASYAGNPANYPANITTITDGDAPSGVLFSTPLEQLADRTAALAPDVQVFTASGTWTKPANAKYVEIVAVAKGGIGGAGATAGGGGGGAGEVRTVRLPTARLPASLTVTFTSNTPSVTGTEISITPLTGFNGLGATGGVAGGSGTGVPTGVGGNGGSGGGAGASGTESVSGGAPGAGQAVANGGLGGKGYGAGGGGGGGSNGGGGGGAGGYGGGGAFGNNAAFGQSFGSGGAGGVGAQGIVVITTWRG